MASGQPDEDPESPNVITADFQQDRALSKNAGAKLGWRRLSPIQKAFELNQITKEHLDAGQAYERLWDLSIATGRNALDDSGGRGFSGGMSLSQIMLDATRELARIEIHMGENDKRIVQCICGQGMKMAETVRCVTGGYTDSTAERVREALTSLVRALRLARRKAA